MHWTPDIFPGLQTNVFHRQQWCSSLEMLGAPAENVLVQHLQRHAPQHIHIFHHLSPTENEPHVRSLLLPKKKKQRKLNPATKYLKSVLFFPVLEKLIWGGCGWGGRVVVLQSEGRQFDPQSSQKNLHAKVSLSKLLNPELCLIEQQSAANRYTVWMCVWLGECKTVL